MTHYSSSNGARAMAVVINLMLGVWVSYQCIWAMQDHVSDTVRFSIWILRSRRINRVRPNPTTTATYLTIRQSISRIVGEHTGCKYGKQDIHILSRTGVFGINAG